MTEAPTAVDQPTEIDPLRVEQQRLEEESLTGGVAQYRRALERLKEKDHLSMNEAVLHLVRVFIEPLHKRIIQFIIDSRHRPGRRALAAMVLEDTFPDVVALLALRTALNTSHKTPSVQSLGVHIGRAVENELRLTAFQQQHPGKFDLTTRYVDESPLSHRFDYKVRVFNYAMKKAGLVWEPWSNDKAYQVGVALLDMIVETTGMFDVETKRGRHRRQDRKIVVPTQTLLDWMDKQHAHCELLHPLRLPMVCQPERYTKFRDGGYLHPLLKQSVVKTKAEISGEFTAEKMPMVFHAVNKASSQAWQVNQELADVALTLWEAGHDLPKLCSRVDRPVPDVVPYDVDKDAYFKTKAIARETGNANRSMHGKRISVAMTLSLARRFSGQSFYFPHRFDFRGRIYAQVHHLSPQGSDLAKALLKFAHKVPLGPDGLRWMRIHLANSFGVDKVSIEERVAWAEQNHEQIMQAGADPYGSSFWHEADNPFQFLAAAMDYRKAVLSGDPASYESSLPITIDGTCNGLQILSAWSRDENTGRLVNLLPSDKPNDIYGTVAARLIENLKASEDAFAKIWLAWGFDRKITKRPTMILPYNGTLRAVTDYTDDYVTERLKDGPHPFGPDRRRAVNFMAKEIWRAMSEVITGPREIMKWTRIVAQKRTKLGKPITVRSPSNFLMLQAYKETQSRRVKTKLGESVTLLSITKDTDKLDSRRQSTALMPNSVHLLDGAVLHKVCDLSNFDLYLNHDSFGGHAGNMTELYQDVRVAFVWAFTQTEVPGLYEQFKGMAEEIPEPPAKGGLEIEKVLESQYTFI